MTIAAWATKKAVWAIGKISHGRLVVYYKLSNGLVYAKSVPCRRRNR